MRSDRRFGSRSAAACAALLVAASTSLGACVSENRPADCDEDAKTIRVTVDATSMEPNDPAACRDQDVTIIVDSSVDGVLHVHGLDTVLPATTISAGREVRLEFTADRSGQFPIELHAEDDPQGIGVGIFTIHER